MRRNEEVFRDVLFRRHGAGLLPALLHRRAGCLAPIIEGVKAAGVKGLVLTVDTPIVVKGILTVEDARRAVAGGVDAIVVSNHDGNVLDGSVPTLPALSEIVGAVGDRIEMLLDSGVRRGTDVLKALSLGARARPPEYSSQHRERHPEGVSLTSRRVAHTAVGLRTRSSM